MLRNAEALYLHARTPDSREYGKLRKKGTTPRISISSPPKYLCGKPGIPCSMGFLSEYALDIGVVERGLVRHAVFHNFCLAKPVRDLLLGFGN